jgi:sulfoxide reductase heme-binding subunit YedZ
MSYRGFHPRTTLLRWGLPAIALGIVIGGTLPTALAELATTWATNRAMLPWVFERLFAFLAYAAIAGSVLYGLLLSTRLLDVIAHRPITFSLHQDLAAVGLGLAGVHGMLLALDRSVPFSLAQIAVPGLAPYAPLGVALGQVGFYLMAVIVGSFYVRRRIGQRAWRALHYLTFLAFATSTAHGVVAGTDSTAAWAWWLYVGASAAVAFLLGYRIAIAVADRLRPPQRRPVRVAIDLEDGRGLERETGFEPATSTLEGSRSTS